MNRLSKCMKKDYLEVLRSRKNLICFFSLFLIGFFVLIVSINYQRLLDLVIANEGLVSDTAGLIEMFNKLFPDNVKENLGIFSSDVFVFYTIVVVLFTYDLIPSEIKNGKWIIPVNNGYSKKIMFTSKCIVYSILLSIPTFSAYVLYYLISSFFLVRNYPLQQSLINAVIMCLLFIAIIIITISMSVVYKKPVYSFMTMLSFVVISPDVFTFFSFGKYLPTYVFSYLSLSEINVLEIVIPLLFLVIITIILYRQAIYKIDSILVDR